MQLLKSGLIVGVLTFISRIFGLIRELFVASYFGTSFIADSVNTAFKLPNLFRRIFGEGAFSAVFIPMFTAKMNKSKDEAINFGSQVKTILTFSIIVIVFIFMLLMPKLMFIIAPGFIKEEKFNLTVTLCRITILYMLPICLVAFYGGSLNAIGFFMPFAASPIIMNISLIIFTKILQTWIPSAIAISYSLIISGTVQLVFILYSSKRKGLVFTFKTPKLDKDLVVFFKKFGPAVLTAGVVQLNLFISQSIASYIPGAVSVLSYADRLYQFPLSMIGVAFSAVLLPALAKHYKNKEDSAALTLKNNSIALSLGLSLPAAIGIIMLGKEMVHIIYERGAFKYSDTLATSWALDAFSFGLPAFVLNKILTQIFYANSDTITSFIITLASIVVNIVLNFIALKSGFGYYGIALGTSIAAWFNLFLQIWYCSRLGYFKLRTNYLFLAKILICNILLIVFLYLSKQFILGNSFEEKVIYIKAALILSVICLSIVIYLISLIAFKINKA